MRRFLAVLLMACATSASANLIVNGSFEVPALPGEWEVIGPGGEPAGFGWTVVGGSVDVVVDNVLGTDLVAQEGTQWLDLNGLSQGLIEQFFTTTPGTTYRVSFWYSDNPFSNANGSQQGVPKTGNMTVRNATDSILLASRAFTHSTATGAGADWAFVEDIVFTAIGTLTRLAFSGDAAAGSTGPFIDNVSVLQVPEPGTLALLLAGLGATLGAGRLDRRR